MKIKRWLFAAAAVAVAIALAGCPTSGGGNNNNNGEEDGDPVWTVLFDLATDEHIQGLALADEVSPDEVFEGTMLTNAGGRPWDVVANNIPNQDRSIRFTTNADWGQGLDLRNSDFVFRAGDVVHISGEIITLPGGRVQVNRNVGSEHSNIGGVDTAHTAVGPFAIDFTIAEADLPQIRGGNPAGLRIEVRSTGAVVRFDSIRVEGYRVPGVVDVPCDCDDNECTTEDGECACDTAGECGDACDCTPPVVLPPGHYNLTDRLGANAPRDEGFLGLARTDETTVIKVTDDGEFVELHVTGAAGIHGLDIILSDMTAAWPNRVSLVEAGRAIAGGTYTVVVEGRAPEGIPEGTYVGIDSMNPMEGIVRVLMVAGEDFRLEGEVENIPSARGPGERARLLVHDASTPLILTSVVVENAAGAVVWDMAEVLMCEYGGLVPVAPETVTVTAAAAEVARGAELQFSAVVGPLGAPQAVTWSVPTAAGTISATGLLTVAADAPLGDLVVTATATGTTPAISGTATVSVVIIDPTGVTVTAYDDAEEVVRGSTLQFSAVVAPAGAPQAVTWSIPETTGISINATGLLTVAIGAPLGELVVTATATGTTPAVYGTISVEVTAPAPTGVSVTPPAVTLEPGEYEQFTAVVAPEGAVQTVTWTVYPADAGTMVDGLFTLDEDTEVPSVTITATVPGVTPVMAATATVTVDLGDPLVTVAAQVGNLYEGDAESYATFAVTASNIPAAVTSVDFAAAGVVSNLPVGVTASGTLTLTDGAGTGTLTLRSSATAVAGETNNVTVTVNGTPSAAFTVAVLPPTDAMIITVAGVEQAISRINVFGEGTASILPDGSGYSFLRGGAWEGHFAWFTVDFGTNRLVDFERVTLVYEGLAGDIGHKSLYLLASATDFAAAAVTGTQAIAASVGIGGSAGSPATGPQDVTFYINSLDAAALDGQQVRFSFFFNANFGEANLTEFQVSNIAFYLGEPCDECGEFPCVCACYYCGNPPAACACVLVLDASVNVYDAINNKAGVGVIAADVFAVLQAARPGSVVRLTLRNDADGDRGGWGLGHFGNVSIHGSGVTPSFGQGATGTLDVVLPLVDANTNIQNGATITGAELWRLTAP